MTKLIQHSKTLLITSAFSLVASLPAQAQLMIYPMKGQSNEQLSKDRYECHLWAIQQSGFDPTNAQAVQQAPQSQQSGQVIRGGARGAAMGAAVGAIAGDAGKGAAIGATAGGIRGAFKRHDQNHAASQSYQTAPGQDAYDHAIKACLGGRNYSVN